MSEKNETNNRKAVYTIVERGEGKKPRWVRIGIAFVNRDDSLNVILDAVPVEREAPCAGFPRARGR